MGEPSATGPGVRWLADRSGCSPEQLLADPARLVSALAAAGEDLADLAARLRSPDLSVREAAQREAAVLRDVQEPDPGGRLRGRVAQALRDAAERVRPPADGGLAAAETGEASGGRADAREGRVDTG